MKTVCITGHGYLSFEDFIKHYVSKIDEYLKLEYSFIIGDFNGVDTLAQEYLKDRTEKVTVCHCFKKPRYKINKFNLKSEEWNYVGKFTSDENRDNYMIDKADIILAHSINKNSRTQNNINKFNNKRWI